MRGPPVRRRCCRSSPLLVAFALRGVRVRHRGDAGDRRRSTSAGDGLDPSDDLDDEIDEPIAPDTGLDGDDAPTSDQVVEAALTDVNAFWQRTYEDLYGTPYEPISGGFWPYGPDTEQPPCGSPPPDLRRHRRERLLLPRRRPHRVGRRRTSIPELYDEFGGFTLGIVFAHEFGHAIQTRAGHAGPRP